MQQVLDGELVESRFAWPEEDQLIGRESQEMYRVSDTKMIKNNIVYINGKFNWSIFVEVWKKATLRPVMFLY